MLFSEIIGQNEVKQLLTRSADQGRIPHAQLFIGAEGSGMLPAAIAYAQYILCNNTDAENQGGNAACNLKFEQFNHPDLHFIYPVNKTPKDEKHPTSATFISQWREFVMQTPYSNYNDWADFVGFKSQPIIGVDQTTEIFQKIALKSYEGGYKIMIIWCADRMNVETANKLLKLLEEPTDNTVFILITENESNLLQTIISRCQIVRFKPVAPENIIESLTNNFRLDKNMAVKLAHQSQGNYNWVLKKLSNQENEEQVFDALFVKWMRSAYGVVKRKDYTIELLNWAEEAAKMGKEQQKLFLHHTLEMVRQAFLLNYKVPDLIYMEPQVEKFDLKNFAPFVHHNNIFQFEKELTDAIYHLERNGNSNLIFTDLSLNLTRLLHTKP
ncbi:DNA polymerase III subunit delta' [Flavobacterium agricola]|uniref:DNA polymerase III subunit delta n=1 Tax=Flavobacterium agricola TaxID=2870839 RepID=A0ABY6M1N1_9FLAO|nr:DNA polymerase III subunit delta' [Flavobacterium agricola]UYW01026.1 DNA polymerase III subunit delta' [Flavobacterium agricola]